MSNGRLTGKRKFTVAMTALVMSFVLGLSGVVEGGEWVASIGLIVGLYGAANVGEHWTRSNGGST